MVKKYLTILTSFLMVLGCVFGGGVSSLLTATPVLAEGETADIVISVPGGENDVYYWVQISDQVVDSHRISLLAGKTITITSPSGTETHTLTQEEVTALGESILDDTILFPLKNNEVLTIEDGVADGYQAYMIFVGVDPFFFEDEGEMYSLFDLIEFTPDPADFSNWSWMATRLNAAISDFPATIADAPDPYDLSNFDAYDEGAGQPFIVFEEFESEYDFTFTATAPAPSAFTQYASVAGDSDIPLNKYLVLAEDAQVPTATFNFAVSNGTGIPASTGIQEVLAPTAANGVGGSAPTIASISYTAADTASMTDAADAGVTLSSGQKYVKKTTYVDFSSTTFAEPGIYRYVITESGANGVEAIFNMDAQKGQGATAKQRILDVYVTDANDGTNVLSISEYVLHELADNVPAGSNNGTGYATSPIADKSVGYVNVFLSQNLAVANKTDGNQGSRDKYFAYTVALTGLQGEKAYDVDISNADAEVASTVATAQGYRGNSNPTTLTSLANGSASGTFYLRDDQNIEIKGLPVGVGYTVTAVAEDYKQTAGATITAGTFTDSATGTIASADINTGYTHTRNGVIPTGIAVSAAGTIAIAGFAVAGLLAKRRKEDEE